jgi:Uma2 family endonuclease
MAPQIRMTVDDYHRLIEQGILGRDDHVELLDGVIVEYPRITPAHSCSATKTLHAFLELNLVGWHVRPWLPVRLATSEPQPDLAVVRAVADCYGSRHPGPEDIALLLEVSEKTLKLDRTCKLAIYAAAGIAEYWIVNLIERCVECYWEPSANGVPVDACYRRSSIVDENGLVEFRLGGTLFGLKAADLLTPKL